MSIDQTMERIFTPFQEDLARVGIKLNLRYVTPQTMFKNVMNDRDFDIHYQSWTGLTFPNPESSFGSEMADIGGTTNITGVKNDRIDEICEEYNVMYDAQPRIEAIREIDRILVDMTPYALGWYAPYTLRLVFWNKFGYPDTYLGYSGDWSSMPILWWFEPDQGVALEQAKKDESITFPHGVIDIYYDDVATPQERSKEAL
jgi:microcin C transport system substrate-binding protein